MKIRMLFGTFIPQPEDRPDLELPVESVQDLPKEVAQDLIEQGRAELIAPVKGEQA